MSQFIITRLFLDGKLVGENFGFTRRPYMGRKFKWNNDGQNPCRVVIVEITPVCETNYYGGNLSEVYEEVSMETVEKL